MLNQLLEKLGITNYDQLTAEEKKTYQTWSETLVTPELTLDNLKKLITSESERARQELLKLDNSKERDLFFKTLSHFTETLKLFIETPSAQRDALKAHLKQVFNIDI